MTPYFEPLHLPKPSGSRCLKPPAWSRFCSPHDDDPARRTMPNGLPFRKITIRRRLY